MIEASHITKSYYGKKVLDDVSLRLGKNETICIIGSMGSGKSTLLRCMAGLESPELGIITLDGHPLVQKGAGGYNHIGMVFQNINLFPHFNVLHNLILAPVNVLGISKKEAEEQALQQLDKVGLSEKALLFPHELSPGQKQRVAIARAVINRPDILLADEPTGALDSRTGVEVLKFLQLLNDEGNTIVLITHDNSIAKSAKRIVRLHDGQVVYDGPSDAPEATVSPNVSFDDDPLIAKMKSEKGDEKAV